MVSYVIEGFLEEVLSESSEAGKEFRDRFVLFCVPFVDVDGVEAGDQRMNRLPYDHNRDYTKASIYPEVRAIQVLHKKEKFSYALDMRYPTFRKTWKRSLPFPRRLRLACSKVPHGPFVWLPDEIKPSPKNSRWFAFQDGMIISATLEIPFAPGEEKHTSKAVVPTGEQFWRRLWRRPLRRLARLKTMRASEFPGWKTRNEEPEWRDIACRS